MSAGLQRCTVCSVRGTTSEPSLSIGWHKPGRPLATTPLPHPSPTRLKHHRPCPRNHRCPPIRLASTSYLTAKRPCRPNSAAFQAWVRPIRGTCTYSAAGTGNLLPRKYSLNCPEMLGLRARREIGSSRLPDSAKGQTTPVPARDQLCWPKCDGFADRQ